MDERIILLETSTSLCSTALLENGQITASRQSQEPRAHASMTAPFVQQMLEERGLGVRDCNAVCLSMGPGSYTGLRVGSSTAKGLCFGAGIPLLAVSTLDVLVAQALEEGLPEGCRYIVPMIDARRMEVYTATYTAAGERLDDIQPRIVGSGAYADLLSEGPVLFIGDGVLKCKDAIGSPLASFRQECPRADAMKAPAMREYSRGAFRDTAYFEPFYLKEFVATVGKKLF